MCLDKSDLNNPGSKPIAEKKVLLFDFDGVLVNSEPFYLDFWLKTLRSYHIIFNENDLKGKTNLQFVNQFNLPEGEKNHILEKKLSAESNYFKTHFIDKKLFKLIILLQAKYKLGIVSNNKNSNIKSCLIINKINFCFDLIISEEQGMPPKPSPMPYLLALNFFKAERKESLIIEDSPIGFESAEGAEIDYLKFNYENLDNSIGLIYSELLNF